MFEMDKKPFVARLEAAKGELEVPLGVGVVGHVEICDNVHVTGMTMVTKSITEPGSYSSGTPMTSTRDWKRNAVGFAQLDAIRKRLKALETQQNS